MNVIINGLLTNYMREGKGSTILLLHGWADQSHTYDALTECLKKDYEVVRLDLAGFGGSQPPSEAWGLDEYAQYVGAFVEKIGISPIAIVGHSNGGAVSIKALAN